MPDNAVALGINANPIDLKGTLSALSQIELANAHQGLYNIQALQQQRQYNALQAASDAWKNGQNPTSAYLSAGGDPAGGQILQNMAYERMSRDKAGGGVFSPQQVQELTGAEKNRAETGKIGLESDAVRSQNQGRIAQGYLANPNDSTWGAGVSEAMRRGYIDRLNGQRLLAVKDPAQRAEMAKSWVAAGVSPAEATAPEKVGPTDRITSRLDIMMPPTATGTMVPTGGADAAPTQTGSYGAPATFNQRFGKAPTMTPQQLKETEAYGGEMAKVLPTLAEKSNNSRQANFTLDQMKAESQSWDMGKGGTALMAAQQYLKPIANAFGSTAFDKPVADFESFQKNAGTLVRQAVKEVSPRAAVQEFQMIQSQLPSADMSRQGFNQIVDQFQAVNDFNIAKHQAGQAWRDATGTMDKFETEWNKNITPSAFLISRLNPAQLGALKANLERTAEGRSTLANINRQLKWAADHNLDQLVR